MCLAGWLAGSITWRPAAPGRKGAVSVPDRWGAGRLAVGAVLAVLGALGLSGIASGGAATIKVGVIDPYTGPAALFAEYALQGFKMAVEEANRTGVLGATLTYVTRDTEFRPDVAVQRARELILRERVQVLAGTTNNAAALAVSRLAREFRVPFFVWISQSERITGAEGHRYVFQTIPNTAMSGRAGAVQMARLPYSRYWIAGSDYEYGHAIANSFWTYLKQFRPDVEKLGESWWPVGERDFAPYLTAIAAARPEVLVLAVGGADITGSAKAVSTAGLNRQMAVWVHTITDRAVLEPLGDEAPSGLYGTNGYYHYYPETPPTGSSPSASCRRTAATRTGLRSPGI